MASHPPGQCCVVGVKHEGETHGKLIKIDGKIDAYIATPAAGKAKKDAAILYAPDVIGIWQNSKLMADQFAANGYLTLIPDLYNGDALSLNRPGDFDFMAWQQNGSSGDNPHTPAGIDPIMEATLKTLKEGYGATKIGAVGYCFGAKYVARHSKNGIKVGYMAHPTFVEEDELSGFKAPLSIAAAETDHIFPTELRHRSEQILKDGGNPYQINLYSGTEHGFGVRGDPKDKAQRFAKEQAFIQAVQWFDYWLVGE